MTPLIGARKAGQLVDDPGCVDVVLASEQLDRLDKVSEIELGFPYDLITGGRPSLMGEIHGQGDDHRHTVA